LEYNKSTFTKDGKTYKLYDKTPKRKWQHLSWFEYRCYLICSLPHYISKEGKPKVQNTVAKLLETTPYIVRSIMEDSVKIALLKRGEINDLKNISLDEKAYTQGHKYATILIDSDKNYVVDMVSGRKEEYVRRLFFGLNSKEKQSTIEQVNVDMWRPYINVTTEVAPQAKIVHDKFHLFQKLSNSIDKTRRREVKEHAKLKNQKYTALKNEENRTEDQQKAFEQMVEDNLLTAKAWQIR